MSHRPRSLLGLAALALALALPVAALADDGPSRGGRGHEGRGGERSRAPEFDPTTAGAIAAAIAGGTVLIARRRKS